MARILSDALMKTLKDDVFYLEEKSPNTIKTNRHLIRKRAQKAIQDLIVIARNVKDRDVLEIFDKVELSKLLFHILIRLNAEQRDKEYPVMLCVAMEEAINREGRIGEFEGDFCKIKMEYAPDDKIRKQFLTELTMDAL